jgi:plasmid maintenance system antidote protein VapI
MPPPIKRAQGIDLNNVPKLLDTLRERNKIKSDAALARELDVVPSVISKLRGGGELGPTLILRIHEYLGMSVTEIRELAK